MLLHRPSVSLYLYNTVTPHSHTYGRILLTGRQGGTQQGTPEGTLDSSLWEGKRVRISGLVWQIIQKGEPVQLVVLLPNKINYYFDLEVELKILRSYHQM